MDREPTVTIEVNGRTENGPTNGLTPAPYTSVHLTEEEVRMLQLALLEQKGGGKHNHKSCVPQRGRIQVSWGADS